MAAVECLGADGLLLNQNIDAITAIFSAGAPQIYSLFCFSPPCLSNQFRLNHNPPPPHPPLFLPLSLSQHPSSSLRFCIPTSSMCNDLAGHRQTLIPTLFTERQRCRRKCHTDRNNPFDKASGCIAHFLSHTHLHTTMHANTHTHTHYHIRN